MPAPFVHFFVATKSQKLHILAIILPMPRFPHISIAFLLFFPFFAHSLEIFQIPGKTVGRLLKSLKNAEQDEIGGVIITGLSKEEAGKLPEAVQKTMEEMEEKKHFPIKVIGQHGNFKFEFSHEEYKVGTGYFFERVERAEGVKLNGICYPDETGAYSNYFDRNIPMWVILKEANKENKLFRYRRC